MKKANNSAGLHAFTYRRPLLGRDKVLHCDAVEVQRLANKFGTPLYVYSASAIRDRFRVFDGAFDVPHTVCYSVKANSNLSLLKMLAGLGAGFDIVSGGELKRVLRASRKAAGRVVFSGVGKTRAEIEFALKANILLFNSESEGELELLSRCARTLKRRARVALRVNPDVPANTHPYISTGLHEHKFGIPIDVAPGLYRQATLDPYLEVCGISCHIGSQITDVAPFASAVERLTYLVRQLLRDSIPIRYLDAGGGLGISYQDPSDSDFETRTRKYATALTQQLSGLDVHLLLEPGRAIVGPTGALITRVLYRKTNNGKHFIIVDAAMNDLIRPSLYGAHHEIVPVISTRRKLLRHDVVGPICESGDFFAHDRDLPAMQTDELLAILDTGAYGMSLSSNYNTRPRAPEVFVDGRSSRLVRRRETVNDLLRHES